MLGSARLGIVSRSCLLGRVLLEESPGRSGREAAGRALAPPSRAPTSPGPPRAGTRASEGARIPSASPATHFPRPAKCRKPALLRPGPGQLREAGRDPGLLLRGGDAVGVGRGRGSGVCTHLAPSVDFGN